MAEGEEGSVSPTSPFHPVERTYAIGDIHGRYDLLMHVLDWIELHSRAMASVEIVFLGDYIDRGPQSQEVIFRLMTGPTRSADRFVCLRGNHEDMLLTAQKGSETAIETWVQNGGMQTLESYGGWPSHEHIEWLRTLPLSYEDDYRFFVHAGVNPKRSLTEQTDYDRLWIRDRFLKTDFDAGKHIVHGHTPVDGGPDLRPYRTNMDTGAVWTDRLGVAVFDPFKLGGPISTHVVTTGRSLRATP